jgi:hypothetical protein
MEVHLELAPGEETRGPSTSSLRDSAQDDTVFWSATIGSGRSAYLKLFLLLGAAGAFSAAPLGHAFNFVSLCSLKVFLGPQAHAGAAEDEAFGLGQFLRVEPSEHGLVTDADLFRYLLSGEVFLHGYDSTPAGPNLRHWAALY